MADSGEQIRCMALHVRFFPLLPGSNVKRPREEYDLHYKLCFLMFQPSIQNCKTFIFAHTQPRPKSWLFTRLCEIKGVDE